MRSIIIFIFFILNINNSFSTSINGYYPELDSGPDRCCKHNANWDDPFTLMCETCAYNIFGKGNRDKTYNYYKDDQILYEIKCSEKSFTDVDCFGKNNQNSGQPRYSAMCNQTCIDNYSQIPGKNIMWIKYEQFIGKVPDCKKITIKNTNYIWATLDECKKNALKKVQVNVI